MPSLRALARDFRTSYLLFADLEAQLHAWADAFPDVVRLTSIGQSTEGRPLLLLTIGREPDRRRPSAWFDANMHATELCGSSVALALAEELIRLHVEPDGPFFDLPRSARDRLRQGLVHILPRMSPDGAESVLTTGRYCRSNPRDRRPDRGRARWVAGDLDGDGLALLLRKADPGGEFVESRDRPGLMLPRRLEDEGPTYKLWTEGTIEGFDGNVPDPSFLGDNDTDMNRNFPFMWAPEPEQIGAGAYPTSEPESRAVVAFTSEHPEIFAWVNYHTFGGVFIRPLGHQPDSKMERTDLALYRQLGAWAEALTGYPMVSGHEEFLYEADKPLHGDLSDFAFHQRGAISYVVELWDLFARLGIARIKPFADHYKRMTRDDLERLARWDAEHNDARVFRPWVPVEHPQLGAVEVGGMDSRVGISNPPFAELPNLCHQHVAHAVRLAALAPAVEIELLGLTPLGGDVTSVEVAFTNVGYLPTYVLASARRLPWNEPLRAEVSTEGSLSIDPADARREIGHLDGWGRGLGEEEATIFYMRSRGSGHRKVLRWTVRGSGVATFRATSCRVGTTELRVTIP